MQTHLKQVHSQVAAETCLPDTEVFSLVKCTRRRVQLHVEWADDHFVLV